MGKGHGLRAAATSVGSLLPNQWAATPTTCRLYALYLLMAWFANGCVKNAALRLAVNYPVKSLSIFLISMTCSSSWPIIVRAYSSR